MKKPRIYLDTSVVGGCVDSEFAPWSNGLLQDFRIGTMLPVLSTVLAAEVEGAPEQVREIFAELLSLSPELVHPSNEAYALASLYQQHGILTPKYYDDGLHIALATIAVVDLLVSWNFRHIVRYDKIRQFNAVNLAQGYRAIQIHTRGRSRTMAQNEIRTVEMVRRIRDRHHELLKNKTPEERTAFYEAKAKAAMERAKKLLHEQAKNGGK